MTRKKKKKNGKYMYMHVNCKMEEIIGRINRLGIFCMANESLSVTISHQRKKKNQKSVSTYGEIWRGESFASTTLNYCNLK